MGTWNVASMRLGGSALSTLLVFASACSAAPFQEDALRVVPLLDMESCRQRSLLQAAIPLDAKPSPGLTGAQPSGTTADTRGPMGGTSPMTGTGPSGMGGPTSGSPLATEVPTVSPTGADLIEVAQRRTMGGLRCRLPIVYEGELWTDCQLVDGIPRCAVRGQRTLKKCAVTATPKSTALPALLAAGSGADGGNGSICSLGSSDFQLPKCESIYACLSMTVGPLANSGLGYCGNPELQPPATTTPLEPAIVEPPAAAPVNDFTIETPSEEPLPMEAAAAAPTTGGLTSTDALTLDEELDLNPFESILIPKRTTVRGTACRLPVVYKGRLIEDCVPLDRKANTPQCFTRGLRFVAPCNNGTDYITATLASMLAEGTGGDGEEGAVCSLSGDDLSGPSCVEGLTCTVLAADPLDGTDIGFCKKGVATAPSQSVSASVVQVDAAAPAPVGADMQAAVDAMAPTVDATAADQSDETTPDGGAEAAAPTPGGGIPAMSVAQRVTVTGDACRLPLVFGSNLLLDCLPMSSVDAPPQCFTIGVSVPQQCSKEQPWPSQTVTELLKQHNGTDGYTGSLCNVDAGKENDTTVDVTGTCRFGLTCKPLAGALTGSGIGYCAMAAYTNMSDVNEYRVTRRNSIDGAPCRLPLIQGGNLLLDCVSMNSSIPMCMVSGNPVDPPRPCSPAQPGTRVRLVDLIHAKQGMDQAEGSLCTALKTPAVEDPGWQGVGCNPGLTCTAIGGPFNGSEYGYCRKDDAPAPSAEPTAVDVATSKFSLRTTTLGSSCRLPLVYGAKLLVDCTPLSPGSVTPECFVAGQSDVQECSPLGDVKGPVVAFSTWLSLPVIPDGLAGALCHLPSATVNGTSCKQALVCLPLPPGLLNSDTIGYCGVATDVAMGPALSPTAESILDGLPVASRVTNSGLACRLPVYYKGELLVDCKEGEGTSVCFTQGLSESGTCAAKQAWAKDVPLSQLMAGAPGSDGQEGALCPLISPPSAPAACLPGLQCTEAATGVLAGSQFGYCSPLSGHVVSDGINSLPIAQRTTPSGAPCRLPVIHNGTLMVDCVVLEGTTVPSCFTEGLTTQPCTSDSPAQTVALGTLLADGKGTDGQEASLCLPRGSQAARNVSAMLPCGPNLTCVSLPDNDPLLGPGYGYCSSETAPLPIAGPPGTGTDSVIITPRTTLSGVACRLPVAYGNELLTDCINESGMELCFTQGLEKTAPCSASVFPNVTLTSLLNSKQASDGGGGALCLLAPPPTGNYMPCANPIYSCQPFQVGPLVGSSYGYCARGAANSSASGTMGSTSFLATLPVADRKTLDGARCRLPLVHLGQLYTDCMHVNGVLRCYVLGSSDPPRDCAPEDPASPPIMATALIAANESADGLSGSLCTLGTLGSRTGEILPCTTGLECTQLEGPLTSEGYGYCEVPLAAVQSTAGSLYVPPPTSGRSCGPRCVGGAFLGSVVALAAVTGGAYFMLKRQGKARGAQPFGGAFSRFNNAPTGARPISSLDAAVNGSLRSSGSGGRGLGTLPPEGHVQPTPFSTAFPPGKPGGAANGAANRPGVAALSISRVPSAGMERSGSMARQPSAGLSTWAKSRQGSLISPTFLDQYVAPDAGKAPEQEKSV